MKKFGLVIILGTLLRLILASITFHTDVAHFDLAGQVLSSGNILKFYDYKPSPPFNYPPSVYFIIGGADALTTSWENHSFHQNFLYNYSKTLGSFELNLHLLLLKLPYLLFDLGTVWLFIKMFDGKRRTLAVYLWEFNPIVFYATYMIGQFDIIPVFFVTLALYLAQKDSRGLAWSALALGIGAAFKIYPLFLIVPLMSVTESWIKRVQLGFLSLLPYGLSILPFLFSHGFRSTALVANQSLKSLYAQMPVSGGESILIFMALLIFFYLLFLKRVNHRLWERCLIVLLLFFSLTHYHPQWFLWLTPFLMFDLIFKGSKNILALILSLLSFTVLLFFFDSGLTYGLFSPIILSLYNAPAVYQIFHLDINFLRSFFQTIFVGVTIYYFYEYREAF